MLPEGIYLLKIPGIPFHLLCGRQSANPKPLAQHQSNITCDYPVNSHSLLGTEQSQHRLHFRRCQAILDHCVVCKAFWGSLRWDGKCVLQGLERWACISQVSSGKWACFHVLISQVKQSTWQDTLCWCTWLPCFSFHFSMLACSWARRLLKKKTIFAFSLASKRPLWAERWCYHSPACPRVGQKSEEGFQEEVLTSGTSLFSFLSFWHILQSQMQRDTIFRGAIPLLSLITMKNQELTASYCIWILGKQN